MEQSADHSFADLSRFMKRSPRLATYVAPTFVFLILDILVFRSVYPTLVYFLVPLPLIILIDAGFVKIAKFHFPARRIFFLDFLSFFIANFYFLILTLIVHGSSPVLLVAIAFCSAGLMRSMIFYAYYTERISRIFLPSMAYTLCSAVVLFAYTLSYQILLGMIVGSIIFTTGGLIFASTAIRSFSAEFGQSPIKLLNFLLNIHSNNDAQVGDKIFSRFYNIKRTVPVKVISVEKLSGERKVLLVFPYVHPGPFGSIGTSNLPYKISTRIKDISEEVMVFHTATTNSNNCGSQKDIDTIASAIRESMENLKYANLSARIKKLNSGDISVSLLRMGDFGIGALIPERERFDDVKLTEGLKITEEMIQSGAADFAVIDAQNHFSHGASSLDDCDTVVKTFTREFKRLEPRYRLQVGYSRVTAEAKALGPLGIQTLVFRTDDSDQAIVLTDSNNITDEVMDLAARKIGDKVSYLDIYTTDNHYVNESTLDMNPLGQRDDSNFIADLIKDSVEKAISDVEDCVAGMGSSDVEVSMGDESVFDKLLTNVFRSVKRAKYSIFATATTTVVLSFLTFFLVPWSMMFP